ncbi:hypothetical protein [Verrucosispora sp. NA02020]|uniref:hypothetical protein n=1 Tax=Verrucosispora sp. NA02020 TaxID=2742132 RepID=UPI001590AB99|nr:hypothetical protein [Verrucosispora sp. NA02020]QKW15412.1 hypothetical protein HUT12_23370 [Verrucosispora sp. NA02020]
MSATAKPRTFTMLPDELFDLVADGKISKNAAWLYAALLRHHNRKRRDDNVWPSRTSLARACGLKKPESVDGYMDELKKHGLVEVSERRIAGMKASNRYTLTLIAEGNPGPAPKPADVDVSAGQPDTPKSGQRYPQMGGHDTPARGYELDEGELHQGEQHQPSLSGHTPTVAASSVKNPQPRERETGFSDQKFPSSEHRILAKYGWQGQNADAIISRLRDEHDIYGVGWYVTADKNGTLPDRIQELVDERLAELPDWTGPRPENGRWPTSV